jgi:hypothetical protein
LAAALVAALPTAACAQEPGDAKCLKRAKELHKRIIAFDTHLDLPFDYAGAAVDGKTQIDLPKVARGQLEAALAVFVPQGPPAQAEGVAPATVAQFVDVISDAVKRIGIEISRNSGAATSYGCGAKHRKQEKEGNNYAQA